MRIKFLVVVYPPPPAKPAANQTTYTINEPPRVRWITASSPQAAANEANVEPGGHALVLDEADVERFDRAAQAPLEQRLVDGSHLPTDGRREATL